METTLFVLAQERQRGRAERGLTALGSVVTDLGAAFGTWQVPWGEINRLQLPENDTFSDQRMSLPVPDPVPQATRSQTTQPIPRPGSSPRKPRPE